MKKFWRLARAHKIISAIIFIAIGWGGYSWYASTHGAAVVTRYVIQKAAAGTVVASISGSGQMQAVNTIDIKPQGSAVVTSIPVKVGDTVKAGQLLVQIDTTVEVRALAQAKLQLQSAQLSLAKLTQNPATTTLIQDQNAVTQAQSNIIAASTTLAKDYQTGFNSLASAFVDLQNVMSGLQNFVNGGDIVKAQGDPDAYLSLMPLYLQTSTQPYRDDVYSTYNTANLAYQKNLTDYRATDRSASPDVLDALFTETYHTAQTASEAVKATKTLLNYVVNNYPTTQGYTPLPAVTNTWQTNMSTYTTTANNDVGNLVGAVNAITTDRTAFVNAQLSLNQNSSTLDQLLAGTNPLDIQSSELSVEQQQLALQTAEQNLANDSIRAPVGGVISALPAVVGATVSSPAVSMIGQNQIAQMTLNEVDAAKVKAGNKATLTFSALSGLSLAGEVIGVDPVGTVSQGVVSYNVKISLSSQNDQIKPGMSVSATIVTQANQNVLAVPNSAVVKQGGTSYVLEPQASVSDADIAASANGGIVLASVPNRAPVTTGLVNTTQTEIVSGINVGDQIIVKTVNSAGSAAAPAATGGTNVFRAIGGGGLGGGRGPGQ